MTDTTPLRVWFFANFKEIARRAYTTSEAAQRAAVTDYEASDTGPGIPGAAYEWIATNDQPDDYALLEGGVFTGYSVQPLDVIDDRFETEWTVASHWRHSIEYGPSISEERARAVIREQHDPGVQLSIASRVAGQWRHEDPKAQAHSEQVIAYAAGLSTSKATDR